MTDFLMSIDTEASGLPKNWDLPYYALNNWPHIIQLSWIVYTKNGQEIKRENHYINDEDFTIAKSATKIHGLTRKFLDENGEPRLHVLQQLADDYEKYKPLVFGHFMEFDMHMLGADFYRVGMENPIKKENTFCTMIATTGMVENPGLRFFRLGELYTVLFNKPQPGQHNALADARATGECFFELLRRGDITDNTIVRQQAQSYAKRSASVNQYGCLLFMLAFIVINCLICYYL